MKQTSLPFFPGNDKKKICFETQKTEKENSRTRLYSLRKSCGYLTVTLFFLQLFSSSAVAQAISGTTSVCVGSTTTLSDVAAGGTWSSSNTVVATVDYSTGVVTGITAGTATISYTISGMPVTTDVTVDPLPDAGIITGNNAVCFGSAMTLSDGVTGGVWSAGNGIVTVGSTSGVVTGMAAGSDILTYTVTNSCGTSQATTNITVNGIVGDIYTYGGTGTAGYTGDGGPAFMAEISQPRDLTTDTAGTVYFCDVANNRIRKISRSGIITTVAGNGIAGNTGDGGPAIAASLNGPNGVFVDNSGNVFISNTSSNTIRKVDASGIITTIAGIAGSSGSSGDGGPATAAKFTLPLGILEDASGNIYVADQSNNKVRKIAASTGIITTVAGTGIAGYSGDGGPATAAEFHTVRGLAIDNADNIYIADALNNVIRKYVPSTGIITTFAGTGIATHTGDGGPATAATLTSPARFAYDGANILYITDQSNNVIREVNLATGIISQVAGNASSGFSGDGGTATSGQLNTPAGIAVDHFGNFYIADATNSRIRVVPSTGSIASNITGPTSVCAGTPITLTAFLSGSGGATYQWQKNGVNIGSGGTTFTNVSPVDGDVYRVIVTVTPVCSSAFNDTSNNIVISVSPVASPISGQNPICVGGTSTYTDTASGGTWTSSVPAVATIASDGTLTGVSAGTSIITYAAPNACGSNSTTLTVTVNAMDTIMASAGPNGTITPGTVTLCGGSQTFTITPAAGFHVTDVVVDGVSMGPLASYSFSSLSGNHTISAATFAPDCVAPAITVCPSNVTAGNDAGTCNATVTYADAAITGTSPAITYSQNSGTSFGVGTTIVTVNATNTCGTATCTFAVTINDNENPAIAAPGDVTMDGYCAPVAVTLGTPETADNCGVASVTNDAPSLFPVGTTTVTWTVTDIHGNTATATQMVTVNPGTISAAASVANISCNGLSNGSISTTITGGAAPYSYSWDNGSATSGISGLSTGTYSVTVTDANSCTTTGAYTISQPDALTVSGTVTNVSCNGGSTGSISTTASGGTPSYVYSWSNGAATPDISGLPAGTYLLTVTDANSCSATGSYTITQPAPLSVSGTVTNVSCHGGSTGSIALSVTGGVAAYAYSWSVGATASLIVGRTADTYSVTVTDANGCTATTSYTITQPSLALTVGSTVTNSDCGGGTGAVSLTVTGGTPSYTYLWSNASISSIITGLLAGTFSVTVTDAHGCSAGLTVSISAAAAPSCSISINPDLGFLLTGGNPHDIYLGYGPQTATITADALLGGGLTYSWAPSPYLSCTNCQSPVFTPTAQGNFTFTVTVTNSSGCSSECTVSFCVLNIVDPADHSKIFITHHPLFGAPQTVAVSVSAVPLYLATHLLDRLGAVGQVCGALREANPEGSQEVIMADDLAIAAYPNPFNDDAHIKIESNLVDNADVIVYDLTGRIMEHMQNQQVGADIVIGQNLSSGVYIVEVKNGDMSKRIKVVKIR